MLDVGFSSRSFLFQAQELGRRAIHHATHRDAYSGGIIQVYHVKKEGWEVISRQDTDDLYHNVYSKQQGYNY